MNYLIVGLGNIGYEYIGTRHNIGFSTLDVWAQASNVSFTTQRYGDVAEIRFRGHVLTLLKPSTYMNLSGKAVNYWVQKLKIPLENLLVISDDMALPPGMLRMRKRGSAGGHNGLQNITDMLGTDQWCRLRIGIGSHFGFGSQVDFVLGKWTPEEKPEIDEALPRAIKAVETFVSVGPDRAMNVVNTRPKAETETPAEPE